jgi:hypothetical protein
MSAKRILVIKDYWLWQGVDSEGKYFYNVTEAGFFAHGVTSGYYNLDTLLKLKGLN